jgi:hypothetical protein
MVHLYPDRCVSFEDDQPLYNAEVFDVVTAQCSTSHSCSSGLSSPTIDTVFSPQRSRSRSPGHGHIHFDEDTVTIETITEAALVSDVDGESVDGVEPAIVFSFVDITIS